MLLKFNEYFDMKAAEQLGVEQLNEKLIIVGNGAKYGQVIFLAGGAGSGKGFAIKNFMQGELYKVRDVDEFKKAYLELSKLTGRYPDIAKLNLKNPDDVFALHMFVKQKGIKNKTLNILLKDMISLNSAKKGTLPNIIFDITLQDFDDITEVVPKLIEVGYETKNIHLTWVLTNYKIAAANNAKRDRVVPIRVLMGTHQGASQTMLQLVQGKTPKVIGGQVNVILNNPEHTVFYQDNSGKNAPTTNKIKDAHKTSGTALGTGKTGRAVIKDFKYINLKKEGKPFINDAALSKQLYMWITKNVPKKTIKDMEIPKQ